MTKEYDRQIINMSVMSFCLSLAACTKHFCAPTSKQWNDETVVGNLGLAAVNNEGDNYKEYHVWEVNS